MVEEIQKFIKRKQERLDQNYEVSDTDAIIVFRLEKGRISQSNVGTLLVLPGTTVLLSKDKHEK